MSHDRTVEIIPKIENGVVIDHIPAGIGPRLLEVVRATPGMDTVVMSLGLNFPSTRLGRKDMLKVHTGELPDRVVQHLSLVAPGITIKRVRDFGVDRRYVVTPPQVVRGLARCRNPNCLSNHEAGVEPRFEAVIFAPESDPWATPRYRCVFCERVFAMQELELLPLGHG
jgi:aspartate carbamoyltransferase regulatory subunit